MGVCVCVCVCVLCVCVCVCVWTPEFVLMFAFRWHVKLKLLLDNLHLLN